MQANKIDDLEVQVAVISALSERSGPLQVPGESTPTEEPLTLDNLSGLLTPLLDAKADGDYVEAQLDLKADGNYVDAQLDLKAGRDDVDTQLDLKADGVYVDEQLALKPNSATIMPVINGKADTQTVIDLEAQFNTIQAEVGSCVQLCEANIQPAVNAEIALDMDMSSIEEGTPERSQFESDFKTDMAAALGVPAEAIGHTCMSLIVGRSTHCPRSRRCGASASCGFVLVGCVPAMAVSFGLLFIIFLIHGVLFGPVFLKIKFPSTTTWRVVGFRFVRTDGGGVWFAVESFVLVL